MLQLRIHFAKFIFQDDWDVIGFDNRPLFDYHARTGIEPETGGGNSPIGHLVHHKGEWYFRNACASEMRVLQEGSSRLLGVGDRSVSALLF